MGIRGAVPLGTSGRPVEQASEVSHERVCSLTVTCSCWSPLLQNSQMQRVGSIGIVI